MRTRIAMWLARGLINKRRGPLTTKALLEKMAIDENHPVLEACLAMLRGMQEEHSGRAAQPKVEPSEARYWDGGVAALEDAQERILALVKLAKQHEIGTEARRQRMKLSEKR